MAGLRRSSLLLRKVAYVIMFGTRSLSISQAFKKLADTFHLSARKMGDAGKIGLTLTNDYSLTDYMGTRRHRDPLIGSSVCLACQKLSERAIVWSR